MKNLRRRFDRFCYQNRDKGIPNLMLYVVIGSAIVYLLSLVNGGDVVYTLLCFDKSAILKGQIWRLVSFVFTYSPGSNPILILIYLFFSYQLGRMVNLSMGNLRFNLFYFSGILLMDIFAMIFCPTEPIIVQNTLVPAEYFTYMVYDNMAYYLHLSLLLSFATANPDSRFMILFIIPVKAWIMGIVYLVLVLIEIFNMSYPYFLFPHNLFPLVALANYLIFTGKDIRNLFPFLRNRRPRKPKPAHGTIPFRPTGVQPKPEEAYHHRCTVCGRTDISDPALEFRYCSRCSGYNCYCEDHINNHTHIQ